jgi:hypothetical protein
MRLAALDLTTGEPTVDRRLSGRDTDAWPAPAKGPAAAVQNRLPGTLPDILSTDGEAIFLGWTALDTDGNVIDQRKPHLFSTTNFLDDTWWHRTYWQVGTWMRGGFGGWPQAARQTPAGRLLVLDQRVVYGYGREKYDVGNPTAVHAGHVGVVKDGYQESGRVEPTANPMRLFAANLPPDPIMARRGSHEVGYRWRQPIPVIARGLVLAGDVLWIAGPQAETQHLALARVGAADPGSLIAVDPSDGSEVSHVHLAAPPVLDGMAIVPGRIVMACEDGMLACYASTR